MSKVQTTNKTFRHAEKAAGFSGLLASGSYVHKRFNRAAWDAHKKAIEAKEVKFSGAFDCVAILSGSHGTVARIARLSDCGRTVECKGNVETGSISLNLFNDETGGQIETISLQALATKALKSESVSFTRQTDGVTFNGRLIGSMGDKLASLATIINGKLVLVDIETDKHNANNAITRGVIEGDESDKAKVTQSELSALLESYIAGNVGADTVKKARTSRKAKAKK